MCIGYGIMRIIFEFLGMQLLDRSCVLGILQIVLQIEIQWNQSYSYYFEERWENMDVVSLQRCVPIYVVILEI